MFAEAINSPAHLQMFNGLAATAGFNSTETVEAIERNINWIAVKAPEIESWVNSSAYVKASIMSILSFFVVMIMK